MTLSSPGDVGIIVFTSDLDLVQENKTYTDLCGDWWSSKQGLVCRGSNGQSPLHQSSSNAAPVVVVVVPEEESQIISLRNTNYHPPTRQSGLSSGKVNEISWRKKNQM